MAKKQHCPVQVWAWGLKMKITQLLVATVGFKGQMIKIMLAQRTRIIGNSPTQNIR
jgi:hypothetical protein